MAMLTGMTPQRTLRLKVREEGCLKRAPPSRRGTDDVGMWSPMISAKHLGNTGIEEKLIEKAAILGKSSSAVTPEATSTPATASHARPMSR